MTVTLGRCTGLDDPWAGTLSMKGDLLSFDSYVIGVAQAGTVVDDMNAKVQQLRGLMDNVDEDVFPATFSEQPEFDGFYTDFDVTVNDAAAMLASGACPFTVSMRRVAGATAAQFENTATCVTMTNGFGIPASTNAMRVGLPFTDLTDTSLVTVLSTGVTSDDWGVATTLTTSDGLCRVLSTPAGAAPDRHRWQWATTPALFYEASAQFEQSFGGTYYPLIGQQSLPAATAWRVSNGLVRVSLSATTIDVSHYDGSAWDTAKSWTLKAVASGSVMAAVKAVRVIRNTPQHVAVRVALQMSTAKSTAYLDISLRRGCRFASFNLTGRTGLWQIENSEAGTAITAGIKATAADASGNKYVVACSAAQNNTVATGTLKLNATSTTFNFCIGSEVGADGSATTLVEQWINATTEDQRVVAR